MGKPVELKGKDIDEDTKRIMKAIIALLPPEAHEKRKPTAEELRKTYPPGKAPTPANTNASAAPARTS